MKARRTVLNPEALLEQASHAPTLETFSRSLVEKALIAAAATITSNKQETESVEMTCKITVSKVTHDARVNPEARCYRICMQIDPKIKDYFLGPPEVCWLECWTGGLPGHVWNLP